MFGYTVRKESLWYKPGSTASYRLSRTRIDNYLRCARCFWLEERFGIKKPDSPPFSLNNAVDELLKREFDMHRARGTAHPLMEKYGVEAVPFKHENMEAWRDALRRGVEFLHRPTNLSVRGGVDDIWESSKGELIVVDYKATSKKSEINLDADWQIAYKRQIEVYQWLVRQNGFPVSPIGYFVYVNGNSDAKAFDAKLEFEVYLLPYKGDPSWIEPVLFKIKECLESDDIPAANVECEYCPYREAAGKALMRMMPGEQTKPINTKKLAKHEEKNTTAKLF